MLPQLQFCHSVGCDSPLLLQGPQWEWAHCLLRNSSQHWDDLVRFNGNVKSVPSWSYVQVVFTGTQILPRTFCWILGRPLGTCPRPGLMKSLQGPALPTGASSGGHRQKLFNHSFKSYLWPKKKPILNKKSTDFQRFSFPVRKGINAMCLRWQGKTWIPEKMVSLQAASRLKWEQINFLRQAI